MKFGNVEFAGEAAFRVDEVDVEAVGVLTVWQANEVGDLEVDPVLPPGLDCVLGDAWTLALDAELFSL